ncbi:hypothetical protein [Thermococcus sp. Bubb.Bath]|uniref:hypothetical protein n=1 Tax=Thermococcus sp. Bubb.Bath TaxID=1638242 RepID=UPI00143AF03B|nr:hypothetical protein [Thermococcus sp. Bubb.Bath]NJF25538.1 hypothetical protein [Thermococcus sp. Bubb.Bath]
MKRGQITFDFLIALMLISVTVVGMISIASGEKANAETFDTAAKLKVFSVDMRDTVTKVYSIGEGFTVVKSLPMNLQKGESVTVTLNSTSNRVIIVANLNDGTFKVEQNLPVPVYSTTSVKLTPGKETFNVTAAYNETEGRTYVELKG